MAQKIRQGDTIQVMTGKDRGKRGKVQRVIPEATRVVVEGVNVVTRHLRPQPRLRQAGRVQQEAPVHLSNVRLVCAKCNKPVRVGFRFLEDGTKVRVCKRCHEVVE